MGTGIAPEFVVAAPNVLHERVSAHDDRGGVVAFESAHRPEAGFESAVVRFDSIVRIARLVERGGRDIINDGEERPGAVGHDFGPRSRSTRTHNARPLCDT